jgi:hypothetical protein
MSIAEHSLNSPNAHANFQMSTAISNCPRQSRNMGSNLQTQALWLDIHANIQTFAHIQRQAQEDVNDSRTERKDDISVLYNSILTARYQYGKSLIVILSDFRF